MPADADAGSIFGAQHVFDRSSIKAALAFGRAGDDEEPIGNRFGAFQAPAPVIIVKTERGDFPLSFVWPELKGLQRQSPDVVDQTPLVLGSNEVRPIGQSGRPLRVVGEQGGLVWCSH